MRGRARTTARRPARGCASWSAGRTSGWKGVQELETIAELLARAGPAAVIDPSVVRGLGYYTGPVVEAELTFEVVGRRRPAAAVRLGGGRRAVRRPGQALHRRGGAGDRHLDRRRPAAGGAGEKGRLAARGGAGGGDGDGPRPDGRLPGDGGGAARGRAPGGGVPRRRQHGAAAQVCRPARRGGGGDRGRGRAGARRGAAQGPGARGAAGGGDRDARGLDGAAGAGGGAARRAGRGGAGDAGAGAADGLRPGIPRGRAHRARGWRGSRPRWRGSWRARLHRRDAGRAGGAAAGGGAARPLRRGHPRAGLRDRATTGPR